jgi:hypothetical protein
MATIPYSQPRCPEGEDHNDGDWETTWKDGEEAEAVEAGGTDLYTGMTATVIGDALMI